MYVRVSVGLIEEYQNKSHFDLVSIQASRNKFRTQFARINTIFFIEKTLNGPITKFYNRNEGNVIVTELRLTKTRPTTFYKKTFMIHHSLF